LSSRAGGTALRHQVGAAAGAIEDGDGDGDGQTAKQTNIEKEPRSTNGGPDVAALTFNSDVIGGTGTGPVTSHGTTSFPGQRSTSCVQQPCADNDVARLTLPQPLPTAFLSPPPPPPLPYPYQLCPSTSFSSSPLFPMRPRPLTPLMQFRMSPFNGCVGFQSRDSGSSGDGGAGFLGVVDDRRMLLGAAEAVTPWSVVVDASRVSSSPNLDQAQTSARCRDEVDRVVELDMTDNSADCEHIDVDTVDESTPSAVAAAAAVQSLSTSASHGMTFSSFGLFIQQVSEQRWSKPNCFCSSTNITTRQRAQTRED